MAHLVAAVGSVSITHLGSSISWVERRITISLSRQGITFARVTEAEVGLERVMATGCEGEEIEEIWLGIVAVRSRLNPSLEVDTFELADVTGVS